MHNSTQEMYTDRRSSVKVVSGPTTLESECALITHCTAPVPEKALAMDSSLTLVTLNGDNALPQVSTAIEDVVDESVPLGKVNTKAKVVAHEV